MGPRTRRSAAGLATHQAAERNPGGLLPGAREAGRFRGLFLAYAAFAIYGSLYPFNFVGSPVSEYELARFFLTWRISSSPGDILGNIGLFLPFGCLGQLALAPYRSQFSRFILVSLLGLVIAVVVQLLQFYLPSRDAALGDVFWNICGWTLGALLVWPPAVRVRLLSYASTNLDVFSLALLACWVLSELAPFVPSIDFQSFKDSLKPLLDPPHILSPDFLATCVGWLVAYYLAARLWPRYANALWLVAAPAAMMAAKVVIIQNTVSSTYVAAVALALLGGLPFLRAYQHRAAVLVCGLFALLLVNSLAPFTLRSTPIAISWVPFSGALTGSMLVNTQVMAIKIFLFGALLSLMKTMSIRRVVAVGSLTLLTVVLEAAQMWIGSHTPETTDPLMVLLIGAAMTTLQGTASPGRSRARAQAASSGQHPKRAAQEPAGDGPDPLPAPTPASAIRRAPLISPRPTKQGMIIALCACLAAAAVMQIALGLPQIPYNVRELFGGEDSWRDLAVFSAAGLSVGLGGALTGILAARGKHPFLVLPGATFLSCLATYLLLQTSVTSESLTDIAGSTITYRLVVTQNAWLYQLIGSESLIATVESYVRFTALFGQVVLWIAIVSALYVRLSGLTRRRISSAIGSFFRSALLYLFAAAPWLILFNLVAFEYPSTDNLTELIAGHGRILYFLLILLPATALVCVHAVRRWRLFDFGLAGAALLISLPVGWLLFKNGLSPAVVKYGQVFSGVDFLLGPDRQEKLPELTLMLRWFAVQTIVVLGLACGMQTVLSGKSRRRPFLVAGSLEVQVNLRQSQAKVLAALAQNLGIERSNACRRIIDLMLEDSSDAAALVPPTQHAPIPSTVAGDDRTSGMDGAAPQGRGAAARWEKWNITLEPDQFQALSERAEESGHSVSREIRRLIADFISTLEPHEADAPAGHHPPQSAPNLPQDQPLTSTQTSRRRRKARRGHSGKAAGLKRLVHVLPVLFAGAALYLALDGRALHHGPAVVTAPAWAGQRADIIFDHHTHTTFSDGALTVPLLVEMAEAGGCDALAVTDHSDASGTASDQQLIAFRRLRRVHPDLLLFGGVEINMPSYGSREHANVIVDPTIEHEVLPRLRDAAEELIRQYGKDSGDAAADSSFLRLVGEYLESEDNLLMIYNHPSRKDRTPQENYTDLRRWNAEVPLFIGFAGAPGHQNIQEIGGYELPILTEDRWDSVVATIGGSWDQLLSEGQQVWGAIAGSDYHNHNLDKAPCAFSRTHIAAPAFSYSAVLKALRAGTFWADHGHILDQFSFSAEVVGVPGPIFPGSILDLGEDQRSVALRVELARGEGAVDLPLKAEFIGNCTAGKAELLGVRDIRPGKNTADFSITPSAPGADNASCFVRARIRLAIDGQPDLMAYGNPIRFILP